MKLVVPLTVLVACAAPPPPQPDAPAPLPTFTPAPAEPPAPREQVVTTASGLQYIDEKIGDGPSPASSQSRVKVQYTGWLADGTKFDSSYDHGGAITFRLNAVIRGWTEGVQTMRVGGIRRLIIPPELAYGNRALPKIPAGSTLTFEVELLGVDDAP